tara:strand:- start:4999 stop:6369 length:1371 start_codon:yes stop_codon:yes gene_type:complete
MGTTNPDPSAILDIVSATQGVLTPRMTSNQRTTISSPAEGLLVFDIDEDVFYFYDTASSAWRKLITDKNERNNYKLVKSDADLADELAAGVTEYLLDSGTLYEINGTINLAVPINLNEAHISGQDTNEDKLVSAGGTIFSGSSGGSIRKLTLTASSGIVFNLSGSGAENLIFTDCVVANSNNVGSISDFNLVFLSVIQYINNSNGITYTDIEELVLNSELWESNNGGVYVTMVGDFNIITKQGGHSHVTTAAAGFDVTGITSISSGGGMHSVDFYGGGNYINGISPHIGYNFTKDWNVDCPGIPVESDFVTTGYYYMTGNTTNTPFVTSDTPVKVVGATTPGSLYRTSSTNNKLVYEGKEAREFQVICTGTLDHRITPGGGARIYDFLLSKTPSGGVPAIVPAISSERRFSNNDIGNFTLVGLINLEPGDAIEVYVSVNNVNNVDTDITRLSVVLK